MGVTLEISTSRQEYFAGDTVEGMVAMEADSKNPEGSKAYELKLTLVGRARTIAYYSTYNGTSTVQHRVVDSDDFLCEETSLGSFDGRVEAGTHSFPFSFSLPEDLLPSMEESDYDSCSVQYSLKARLDNGAFAIDPKSKLRLKIWGSRCETIASTPTVVGPTSKVVRKYFLGSGTMTMVFRVDRLEARTGGAIEFNVALRNDSPVKVTAMYIKMKQLTKWKARSHKRSKKRTLVSMLVPSSELGGSVEPPAAGSERGRSSASIAEAAREDVQQQLAAGDCAQYTIYVPSHALLSMECEKKIEVRHWLTVKLNTTGLNSDPKLSIPVHIMPPETAAESEVVADPVEQQYAEGASDSSS
eukprot:g10462.t1